MYGEWQINNKRYVYWPQDTNRNLKAVDRMLDEYKDIGEQQSSAMERVRFAFLWRFIFSRDTFHMI